ncbi:hypothetical protein MKX03_003173, partial [Papaver bracteatum]
EGVRVLSREPKDIETVEEELGRVKSGICFSQNINWRVNGKLKIHKVVNHRRFKQKRFLKFLLHGMAGDGKVAIGEGKIKKKE